ncbi:hypothetical protein ColTof4_06443 [Colletotrichum tofieldiae]|nr:hypothetical protein ColTof3_01637 [Colletotrichum tofieldiae]GKT74020.1 hypothetical protein ColTof4_06443 [Colletotrichum tofieldiae]GKT96007.1 hypothetical protein Ct61P_13857 [Colletotrichum tofieldiae]
MPPSSTSQKAMTTQFVQLTGASDRTAQRLSSTYATLLPICACPLVLNLPIVLTDFARRGSCCWAGGETSGPVVLRYLYGALRYAARLLNWAPKRQLA